VHAAGLLLGTPWTGDIDRPRQATGAQRQQRYSMGLHRQMRAVSRLQPL